MSSEDTQWCMFQYEEDGHPVYMRAINTRPETSVRAAHPTLAVISWPYRPAVEGMPEIEEVAEMSGMEDALLAGLNDAAIFAMRRTGNGLQDWLFYTKGEQVFIDSLNAALKGQPEFPIEISITDDPEWSTLETLLIAYENSEEAEVPVDDDDL